MRPACPSRASGWSSLTTLWGFPCCVRSPCAHAAATTPVQRMGVLVAQNHPPMSAFPEPTIGSACTLSFSRLAQRSLTLRPAHSHGHQTRDRYPGASDISSPPCLPRLLPAGAMPGGPCTHWRSAAFSRRTWIPDLHLRRRWRWRHGDWSKQANASEDERDLRAQLPSRTVFRPQRIVISSQGEVHRQLATDLHDPAHVGAYRQGPGVVAGGAPVRGKDRRTADIPPAAKIVVPKRLDQEHVVARAGGRQERRRAIAPDSPTARPG